MFSEAEIDALDKIYTEIRDENVDQILSREEFDLIYESQQDFCPTSIRRRLINRVFVPEDTNKPCSILLQRIFIYNELGEWLEQITLCLDLVPETEVRIGFRKEIEFLILV